MSRIVFSTFFFIGAILFLSACTAAAVPTPTPLPAPPVPIVAPSTPGLTQPVPAGAPTFAPTSVAPATPSASPSVPPTPTEWEHAILQQAAASFCPSGNSAGSPKIVRQGSVFTLTCARSVGHSIDVTIERSNNLTTAQKMFSNATQGQSRFYFHIFPATQWDERKAVGSQVDRYFLWQPYRWLIRIHTFDDTPSDGFEPTQVAEAIYQAALQYGMFPR